ncbi:unnamed protein product [Triticum turgidum subsp. durum]|uniref:Uncharacterized protein n=1 Tax=Triticum turgidum subsp. durum TaxID=4567 RepID=A0A9R1PJI0_TRITD|nr:unnamed protein product [Triticum turgidum subsp. durum]
MRLLLQGRNCIPPGGEDGTRWASPHSQTHRALQNTRPTTAQPSLTEHQPNLTPRGWPGPMEAQKRKRMAPWLWGRRRGFSACLFPEPGRSASFPAMSGSSSCPAVLVFSVRLDGRSSTLLLHRAPCGGVSLHWQLACGVLPPFVCLFVCFQLRSVTGYLMSVCTHSREGLVSSPSKKTEDNFRFPKEHTRATTNRHTHHCLLSRGYVRCVWKARIGFAKA